jgi:hypothetical protein
LCIFRFQPKYLSSQIKITLHHPLSLVHHATPSNAVRGKNYLNLFRAQDD